MAVAFSKQLAVVAATGSAFGFLCWFLIFRRKQNVKWQAPFAKNARKPPVPLELDRDKRSSVIKRQFKESEIPSPLDAIVIGSGIGGLSVAAVLAKTGRKVLVLEQHGKAGGWCHTFIKDEVEFDVGIHYIGKMATGAFNRFIVDQLTEGRLDWNELAADFDHAVVGAEDGQPLTAVPVYKDRAKLIETLIERCPDYENGIRKYFKMAEEADKVSHYIVILKAIPQWLASLMISFRWVIPGVRKFFHYFYELNALDVLEQIAPGNKQLQVVLSLNWADCGSPPRRASFGMLASLLNHFTKGAYYPIGGASEIPYSFIPTIESTGGKVLMKARVKEILLSDDQQTAVGVRVESSKGKVVDIKAPIVVSDAGVSNTFLRLLPREVAVKTTLGGMLEAGSLKPGCQMFQVFVGLSGSQADLQLPSRNYWITYNKTPDDLDRWNALTLEEALNERVPLIFLAFPSAKCPMFEERFPNKSACVAITVVPVKWFKPWSGMSKGKRGEDYQQAKMALAEKIYDQVVELFPQLTDRRSWFDAGSPVTAEHYVNAFAGESYGLDHGQNRFSPENTVTLRPKVAEIRNLYLSGQDVMCGSFTGALMGGLLCADSILSDSDETLSLFRDIQRLYKRTR